MKTRLMCKGTNKIRILKEEEELYLIIDCMKPTMPKWIRQEELKGYVSIRESKMEDMESLDKEARKIAIQRYTMIASILPFIGDMEMRSQRIRQVAKENEVSMQTIRKYLCVYLVNQTMIALAPKKLNDENRLLQRQNEKLLNCRTD